jgi:hypothetical protein
MKTTVLCLLSALALAACSEGTESTETAKAPVFSPWESTLVDGKPFVKDGDYSFSDDVFHCSLCRDGITRDDPLTTAIPNGIVWYGKWEDAVAEMNRTGRPILLHFGSPQVMNVCGVW